jgi:enoyl-[acyl-carrier-protein] reductase (NADH)
MRWIENSYIHYLILFSPCSFTARGIPGFGSLYKQTTGPLGRHVTAQEVADTVRFLATHGTGITGQTIYVDGGFSSVVPLVS